MISLKNASRWYGEVIGLNDITCEIGPGVTALLGQNGAGKTTMMRMITGQIRPTTGSVEVFGMAPFAQPAVYKRMGFCPEIDSFPEHLSGRSFVYRMARMMGFDGADAKAKTEEVLQLVGMADRAGKPLKAYSKGMRQRIKLAQAMVHDPDILLLDEPLNGLDPVGRREFMDVLHKLSDRNRSIIVSSHILFEVEQMTKSILLLHRGRLLAAGDVKDIRALIDRYPHRIRLRSKNPRELAARCAEFPSVLSIELDDLLGEVEVKTREVDEFYDTIGKLALSGVSVTGIQSPDNNLESVYKYLVEA
ncbi:ABC transporter ATP-binding protein [Kamptonema cortianum]|nr:ABC transporter ATP-binding protein [Geitlerinema splendidum]MDK3157696.1 ABC transporter ATP-binding protein [Kamptonema cortianum]